jgi:hypothetical protein
MFNVLEGMHAIPAHQSGKGKGSLDARHIIGNKKRRDRKLTDLSAQKGGDVEKLLCLAFHILIVGAALSLKF